MISCLYVFLVVLELTCLGQIAPKLFENDLLSFLAQKKAIATGNAIGAPLHEKMGENLETLFDPHTLIRMRNRKSSFKEIISWMGL